jgi:hypothetical protein
VATNNRMSLLEQLSKYVVEKDQDFLKEALTLLTNARRNIHSSKDKGPRFRGDRGLVPCCI